MPYRHPVRICEFSRRDFLQAVGLSAASGLALGATPMPLPRGGARRVRGAFVCPPTRGLSDIGYCSWPGTGYDVQAHHGDYAGRFQRVADGLGIDFALDRDALDTDARVARFIEEVQATTPDGLLLIPYKRGHWPRLKRILDAVQLPTLVMMTLGVLHADQASDLCRREGISIVDSLDALEENMSAFYKGKAGEWGRG